jgi:MFS superfamily sulfate permease-like transporter
MFSPASHFGRSEGMAYAGIVVVPPVMGLYTIVPALLAYALLGTSRQLNCRSRQFL